MSNTLDIVSTGQITWHGRNGSAEASDLGLHAGYMPQDLLVRSEKTLACVRFSKHAQEVREGDLLWTTYIAVSGGLFLHLTVFND
jgi:hypothetical protein